MRRVSILGVCISVAAAALDARAQSYCGAISGQSYTCFGDVGDQPCNRQIVQTTLTSIQRGYNIQQGVVSCCGNNSTAYYYQGGTCYTADLKPEVQERLNRLTKETTFLVASCNGRYNSYSRPVEIPKPATIHLKSVINVDLGQ